MPRRSNAGITSTRPNSRDNNSSRNRKDLYCDTHGWGNHTSQDCNRPKDGHNPNAIPPLRWNNNDNTTNNGGRNGRNQTTCGFCNKVGHNANDCHANPASSNYRPGADIDMSAPDPIAIPFRINNTFGVASDESRIIPEQPGFRGFAQENEPRWRAAGLRNAETSQAEKKPYCCFCNATSHEADQCQNEQGLKRFYHSKLICAGCRVKGHLKDECKNPIGQRCSKCWRTGHTAFECKMCKTTPMNTFMSAVAAPTPASRFKWNSGNIVPNRIQALRVWFEKEQREAVSSCQFVNQLEYDAVEHILRETEAREFRESGQLSSNMDMETARAQLSQDLSSLTAEVRNLTGLSTLKLNYAVPGIEGYGSDSRNTTKSQVKSFSTPHSGTTNAFTFHSSTSHPPNVLRPSISRDTNQPANLTQEAHEAQILNEAIQKVIREHGDREVEDKINRSTCYARSHANEGLRNLAQRVVERQLLSPQRMDEIKRLMLLRAQFWRDPEAMAALPQRKRPCCMKCGQMGHIVDRFFNPVRPDITREEFLALQDCVDWGLFVVFECDCCVSRVQGVRYGNYKYVPLMQN
ncbi:uncharacterized protein RCC_06693 [Lecanosticta acicola]|uniref:Uncharacterized protein RCC_06693 n=1 Tax=Lecanosticta acicola TaxID=111012 RepID=A0AAI8Z5Y6_9PEZI|nr:uncharacterized protein RCC_06693 [Lecanosticta acicola]